MYLEFYFILYQNINSSELEDVKREKKTKLTEDHLHGVRFKTKRFRQKITKLTKPLPFKKLNGILL